MAKRDDLKKLSRYVNGRSLSVYRRSFDYSQKQIEECKTAVSEYLRHEDLNPAEICVVIVGSVGRYEALSASDIDLIPVGKTQNALSQEMDAGRGVSRDSALPCLSRLPGPSRRGGTPRGGSTGRRSVQRDGGERSTTA